PIHPNAAGIDIGSQHHCVCCACLEDGLTSRLYRSWQDYYEQLYRERMVNNLHKKAQAFGFELIPLHSGNLVS
ncbi:hypothetical protein, partial [Nostoc sp. PCC 9305]|uniref:hypothetical protein n=1 Tax=Nostoc sp. PCC 9305 TaxID=296636 RepID=UPI0039C5D269